MIITSKLRHIATKFISCILVVTIALQIVTMPVLASDGTPYILTSVVTLPTNREKDWSNAEEIIKPGDNLYRGYFHDQVRDYIAARYGLKKEFPITYQDWQKKIRKKVLLIYVWKHQSINIFGKLNRSIMD